MNAKAKHTVLLDNATLISEVRRKMALSDWYLRMTFEEAEAVRLLIVNAVHHEELVELVQTMAVINPGERAEPLIAEARALLAKIEKED